MNSFPPQVSSFSHSRLVCSFCGLTNERIHNQSQAFKVFLRISFHVCQLPLQFFLSFLLSLICSGISHGMFVICVSCSSCFCGAHVMPCDDICWNCDWQIGHTTYICVSSVQIIYVHISPSWWRGVSGGCGRGGGDKKLHPDGKRP